MARRVPGVKLRRASRTAGRPFEAGAAFGDDSPAIYDADTDVVSMMCSTAEKAPKKGHRGAVVACALWKVVYKILDGVIGGKSGKTL